MKRAPLIALGVAAVAAAWILSGQVEDASPPDQAAVPEAGDEASAEAAAPEGERPRVRVAPSQATEHATEVSLFGTAEADRAVDVRAETTGEVVELPGAKGDQVDEGTVLVRLSMDDRAALLEEAEAKVEHREMAYSAAKQLQEKKFRSEVTLAEERAAMETARAALARIRLDIERTRIKAPFPGVLDTRSVELGDWVRSGDVVARVVDLDPIVVSGSVTERDVGKVAVGQPARARFPDGSERDGTVRYVSRTADEETRTFRVEVAVPNPDLTVSGGVTTELTLLTESVMAHRITPAILTLDELGRIGVKTVDDDDRVHFAPVRIVADTPDGVWITGIPDNARVITVGQEFVREGQIVEAVPDRPTPAMPGDAEEQEPLGDPAEVPLATPEQQPGVS